MIVIEKNSSSQAFRVLADCLAGLNGLPPASLSCDAKHGDDDPEEVPEWSARHDVAVVNGVDEVTRAAVRADPRAEAVCRALNGVADNVLKQVSDGGSLADRKCCGKHEACQEEASLNLHVHVRLVRSSVPL